MEGTKNFNERKISIIKNMSKWVQFCKSAAVQPTYLLKRGILQRKNVNNYAKVLITPMVHRGTTLDASLEPSRTSTMELFCKND